MGDALSTLLFVMAMMSLKPILWKWTAWYKLSKSQEKINHLMYIDDNKLFAKTKRNWKPLYKVWEYSQDMGMEFGIENAAC